MPSHAPLHRSTFCDGLTSVGVFAATACPSNGTPSVPALTGKFRKLLVRLVRPDMAGLAAASVPVSVSICLRAGSAAAFDIARMQPLRIDAGDAWITVGANAANQARWPDPSQTDIFLTAGDWLEVLPGDRLVVEAVRGHALRLTFAAPGDAG